MEKEIYTGEDKIIIKETNKNGHSTENSRVISGIPDKTDKVRKLETPPPKESSICLPFRSNVLLVNSGFHLIMSMYLSSKFILFYLFLLSFLVGLCHI